MQDAYFMTYLSINSVSWHRQAPRPPMEKVFWCVKRYGVLKTALRLQGAHGGEVASSSGIGLSDY